MDRSDSRGHDYEPPMIVLLGPVADLTLGGQPGGQGDGSATYSVDAG
jgi:hypothetical protein